MGSSNQLLIKKAKPLSVNKFVVRFFCETAQVNMGVHIVFDCFEVS